MAISDEKHTEYLIQRIRSLGSNTTKWALLFLIGLVYTWYTSIYPREKILKEYTTIIEKKEHFDSLGSRLQLSKRNYLRNYFDNLFKVRQEDSSSETYGILDSNFRIITYKSSLASKDPERLKKLLDSAAYSHGKQKKALMGRITKEYLPFDIIIAMADIQKSEADKQRDSLSNKVAISFDVPGMQKINVGFRAGLLIWMLMATILMIYIFTTRVKIAGYLKDLYLLEFRQLKSRLGEWKKLDLQLPFWIAPILFKKVSNQTTFRAFVGWRFPALNNVSGVASVLLLICLQLHVAWLAWHISVLKYFENKWTGIYCILFAAAGVFIALLWFRPIVFNSQFVQKNVFHFKRREFIKLGATSLMFLFLAPGLGRTIPLIAGKNLGYKRKKEKYASEKFEVPDGFYYHKSMGKENIHYFKNGTCLSFRNMSRQRQKQIMKQMQPVSISSILENPNAIQYSIPAWHTVLEYEAHSIALRKDYETALRILLFAMRYALSKGIDPYYVVRRTYLGDDFHSHPTFRVGGVIHRMHKLIAGLMLRAEIELPPEKWPGMKTHIYNEIQQIGNDVFTLHTLAGDQANPRLKRRWQNSHNIPWQLPKILTWN